MTSTPTQTLSQTPGDLGGHAARGFAWLGVQSVVEKVASGIGQVALAWLLEPGAFKLVGLTYTITVFASLMQSAGLREVLQQRQRRLDVWCTPGFWLSLTLGLASAFLVVGVTPWAAHFYAEPRLTPLLLVSAIMLPLNSLGIVPEVMLRSRMRFGTIAMAGSLVLVGQMTLSILFAALGLGAMSIILPQPVLALARLIIYWYAARPRIRHGPRARRWKFLIGDSLTMLLGSIAFMLTYQGGQIVLGRVYPDSAAAGIYYFCTVLTDQSVRVLVNNLGGVLLPALSKLQGDPARLSKAFLNATGLVLLIGIPMCALQAVLAAPLIRLFFSDKWLPAIACFSAMSVAAIGRLAFGPSESMLLAAGRFRTYASLAFAYSAVFISAISITVHYVSEPLAASRAAIAGGACLLLMGPCSLRLAITPRGGGWTGIFRLYLWPTVCAAVSVTPALALALLMPRNHLGDAVTILVGSAACALVYVVLIRKLAPAKWNQLVIRISATAPDRFRPFIGRLLPLGRDTATPQPSPKPL